MEEFPWFPEQKPFQADLTDSVMVMSVGQVCRNQGAAALGCPACCGHLPEWSNLSAYLTQLF